jgi:hypothetical protein
MTPFFKCLYKALSKIFEVNRSSCSQILKLLSPEKTEPIENISLPEPPEETSYNIYRRLILVFRLKMALNKLEQMDLEDILQMHRQNLTKN